MKRYYRRRIIASAMLAFLILLLLVIGGILLFSYLQTERNTDRTVQLLLSPPEEQERPFGSSPGFPGFYGSAPGRTSAPSTFYEIETDAEGKILRSELRGIADDTDADLQGYVDRIFKQGKDSGKISEFKYGRAREENGHYRVILMDISIQLNMLSSMLRSALIIGAGLSALLLVILLPVSSKAAALILQNTEKQKQFITDAGHELKTPVAVIRSNLDVMELLDGKTKWSGNIRGQVDRLEGLIKQLLLLARLDEKQWTGKTEIIDLTHLMKDEMDIYRDEAEQKELKFSADIASGLRVTGDRAALGQMIHAVMDNAMQYTPAGGNVWVKCVREKKQLRFDVTNTVDALPQIPADCLTDRFTRGDTARSRKTGGTGIGLSTAKSVAEMCHGSIEIKYLTDTMFQAVILLPAA
ncbi:MAG: GHKL domain-containing protein [Clostridia bacterium]|nr:GHKL domain-containing protein [Clostridia bacterium]